MSTHATLLLAVYFLVFLSLAWPFGKYITHVMEGHSPRLQRIEQPLWRLCGIQPQTEMSWQRYTWAILLFNGLGIAVVYALQRLQPWLPLNPQGLGSVKPDLAFNTAISFVTNTNWQAYAGESTMSYFTQMLGLAVQNFLSAATGIVVVIALIRGFSRHSAQHIGNPWVDLGRATLWILLPLSFLYAVFLIHQGVVQNFDTYVDVHAHTQTIESTQNAPTAQTIDTATRQTLAMGPVASQEAIKMLGTNGGGFFNANSAHPYENPTPLSNFVQMLSILLIPAALCFTFGHIVKDPRQGWTVFSVMTILLIAGVIAVIHFEQQGHPHLKALGIDQAAGFSQSGGNMEGKETRFGITESALFAAITTAASCGAVNAMHDSFTPLGGLIPMVNMQLGEVVFGGVGSGLYGMLIFAILAVFMAGLMIGRTPEYLGKKIEAHEMKMSSIAVLITPLLALFGTAVAVMTTEGRAAMGNLGAHGFSEVLYAFTSAANNNGSAFAGLSANTPFYNVLLAIAAGLGRFGVIVPVLALAGSLAAKKCLPFTSGTLPTHGVLFAALLLSTILFVGLLNYVPALALGPVVEHLMLWK